MMQSFLRVSRSALSASIFVLAFCSLALAQTGSIGGIVTDSQGAVVQNADISIRNVGTGATRATKTSDEGVYKITDLSVGTYAITVQATGFKTFNVPDAQLTVAQVMTINPKLEPGAVSEEVQVRADQLPDVDLDSSQISNLVDQRKIKDLPLITRNPYELILLSPGTAQTNALGGISVNGARERNNNFLLDGVDNNDTSVPGIIGGVLSADPDSTQEFRVITNGFNAEYGRNTGAIVDVVTKSGTNTFHGGAYEFGRWNGFGGARDWFNTSGPQDPYIRHQFGYSIGGPIVKNKAFFFFNEEFNKFITTLTSVAVVPTAAFKTGVFTYVDGDGNQFPVDITQNGENNISGDVLGIPENLPPDPTVQNILSLYPTPSSSADGITGLAFFPSSSRQSSYQTQAKLDFRFNDKHSVSLRYGYDHSTDPNPFHDDILPGNIGATGAKSISQGLAANLTSAFSPTLVNTFNFGWNRIYAAFNCNNTALDGSDVNVKDTFGNARDYYLSPFTDFGCLSLVANGQARVTGTTSYGDAVTLVRGSHTFKFGGDYRRIHESGPTNFFSRRQVSMNTFSFFGNPLSAGFNFIDVPGLTDNPAVSGDVFNISNAASVLFGVVADDFNAEFFDKGGTRQGSDNKFFIQNEFDWFGQDTWKLRPNLTLTLGVRYQLDGVPYEKDGNFSNLFTDPAAFPVVFQLVGPGTGRQLYDTDYSGIEPRFGISWDPWGDGKTAVRASFGIFHDRVFGNLFGNSRSSPPFESDYHTNPFDTLNQFAEFDSFPSVTPDTIPSASVPDGALLGPQIFDKHFKNPAAKSWNFGIQRELTNSLTVDVSYVGTHGYHIFRAVDGNPPQPALVQQLVDYCSVPNAFDCTPDTVSGIFLFEGADFGVLPFNAVQQNGLLQPFLQKSISISNYNALQVKATRALSHGLQVQGSYTFSHASDDGSDPIVPGEGNRAFPRNSFNLGQEYGNSDNDVRHIAVINYIWELPFGKGKGYLNSGVMGKILEGMQFSGITSLQSGHPFEIFSSTDSQRTGVSQRADLRGDPYAAGANDENGPAFGAKVWFRNPDAFASPLTADNHIPLPGRPGTTGRNQFYGPGFVNFDLAWSKRMSFTERVNMELRVEGYNIFNHPHFDNPASLLQNNVTSPLFGLITNTVSRPDATTSARQFQVALKLNF